MNILAQGAVFFFAREELTAACLSPETLTDQDVFSLVRQSLQQAGRPIPPCPEIQYFPDSRGVLIFLRPRVEEFQSDCYFSVTFS